MLWDRKGVKGVRNDHRGPIDVHAEVRQVPGRESRGRTRGQSSSDKAAKSQRRRRNGAQVVGGAPLQLLKVASRTQTKVQVEGEDVPSEADVDAGWGKCPDPNDHEGGVGCTTEEDCS